MVEYISEVVPRLTAIRIEQDTCYTEIIVQEHVDPVEIYRKPDRIEYFDQTNIVNFQAYYN